MNIAETKLVGTYIIDIERRVDHRGFFARTWCERELQAHGLSARIAQINVGFSVNKGTLRGLHYQLPPYGEVKIVRCTMGAIYDVVVDLRPDSASYKQWVGIELTAENRRMLYIPEGCAHGYQTLTDDAEICYQTSHFFSAEHARGVRYNDPAFGIKWPLEVAAMSSGDKGWPDYRG